VLSVTPLATIRRALLVCTLGCTAAPEGAPIDTPVWGDELTLALEARVGVLDGDPAYELGRVMQVAVGAHHAFVIADDAAPALRVFDSSGTFVRVIGRLGDGPGEYRSLGGVRTLPDGRIVLWDNRRRLLTTYSDTGAVLATAMVPSGLFSEALLHVQRDGTAWVRTMVYSLDDQSNPLLSRGVKHAWIRVSPEGVVRDTVFMPELGEPAPSFSLWEPSGFVRPFPRERLSTVTVLGEVVSGDNTTYAFERRAADGSVKRVERTHTAVPLGEGERAEWEAWARLMEDQARNRPANERVIGGDPRDVEYVIPAEKPVYRALLSDADGRVWVQRYVAADSLPGAERAAGDRRPRRVWREPSTFDVFNTDGQWLGTVTLPRNTRFADARGRYVWVIGSGDDGEDIVARYRITTPGDEEPQAQR
jgi:hypothetical protein